MCVFVVVARSYLTFGLILIIITFFFVSSIKIENAKSDDGSGMLAFQLINGLMERRVGYF